MQSSYAVLIAEINTGGSRFFDIYTKINALCQWVYITPILHFSDSF